MKRASNVVERVEEYRYHSGYIGDVRPLRLQVLAVRLNRFIKIHKAEMKAAKGGLPKPGPKRRRGR